MSHTSLLARAALAALLASAAACSRSAAAPPFEASLPVTPGEPWEQAHAALAKLDPKLRDATGLGARSSTASAIVTVGGYAFQAVGIAGATDRTTVRSVLLVAPPPPSCDKAREDLVKALGAGWDPGEPQLGALTATKGMKSARIVCTGAELAVSIVG